MKVTPENISRIAKQLFQQEGLSKEQLESAAREVSSGFDDAGVFSAARMQKEQISKTTAGSSNTYAGRPLNDVKMDGGIPNIGDMTPQQVSQLNGPNWHKYQQKNIDPRAPKEGSYDPVLTLQHDARPLVSDSNGYANLMPRKALEELDDTSIQKLKDDPSMLMMGNENLTKNYDQIHEAARNNNYTEEQLKMNSDDLFESSKTENVDANPFLHTDQGKQALDYLFNVNAGKEYSDEALGNLKAGYDRTGEYGLGMMSLPTKANGLMGMLGSSEFGAAIGGGVIGGAANMATGGDFESGFMAGGLAGGLGKSITKNIAGSADDLMRLEKGAISKVLDENKSYDELLESRRNVYTQEMEGEIKGLNDRLSSEKESLEKVKKELPLKEENYNRDKSGYKYAKNGELVIDAHGNAVPVEVNDKYFDELHKTRENLAEKQYKESNLTPGQRPELKTQDDLDKAFDEEVDFNGKKVNIEATRKKDELYDQHYNEISNYQKRYNEDMNKMLSDETIQPNSIPDETIRPDPRPAPELDSYSIGDAIPQTGTYDPHPSIIQNNLAVQPQSAVQAKNGELAVQQNGNNLFKDYNDFLSYQQGSDMYNANPDHIVNHRRSLLNPAYKAQVEKANHIYDHMDPNFVKKQQDEYDRITKANSESMEQINEFQQQYKTSKGEFQSAQKLNDNLSKSIPETESKMNEMQQKFNSLKEGPGRNELDNQLHKEMLKEASQKELGSEAGFFQKRAQNMIKPGTRESGKSTGIESRHMVLGGAALAGGIFGNRKRDHSRGFNSHRGSRI